MSGIAHNDPLNQAEEENIAYEQYGMWVELTQPGAKELLKGWYKEREKWLRENGLEPLEEAQWIEKAPTEHEDGRTYGTYGWKQKWSK